MASTAKTQEFFIGDLDLRISADLTKAGELTTDNGIGLMTECSISMTTNEVNLDAGFPQRTYATAVSSRDLTITGSLSEYSIANLAMLYGDKQAFLASQSESPAKTTLGTAATTGAVTLSVADATDFAVGDNILIRSHASTDDVFTVEITAISANDITIAYGLIADYAAGSDITKVITIELGSEEAIPPVTVQVVGVMPLDQEPFVYDIWKATISGTVEVSNSTDNFGTLPYTISPLAPSANEISCGVFGADTVKQAMLRSFTQGRLVKGVKSGANC
jgi:hypothetical protein